MERFEPRWPLYRVFADYSSRLSLMLTGGRHVCPVAFLYMGQSIHVGRAITPDDMSTAIQDAQLDCDWLPYDVFDRDVRIAGKELSLRAERYPVLVVPPVEVIPYPALVKIKEFFDAGGVVVGYGFLPTKSATLGHDTKDIAALRNAIWGDSDKPGLNCRQTSKAGGRSYLLDAKPTPGQLQQVLADAKIEPALKVLAGETNDWLHILYRVKDDRDVFFVCNQNDKGPARQFKFRAAAAGEPECWDALRNEITAIPFNRTGEKSVEFTLTLEPLETALVVFSPKSPSRPMRIEAGAKTVGEPIVVARDPNPALAKSALDMTAPSAKDAFADCRWVWFPEGKPEVNAPQGTRFFRKTIEIPADRKIEKALFALTADNDLTLYVNGEEVLKSDGEEENWRLLKMADITKHLRSGRNVLAISAVNGGDKPSPAGLIGQFVVKFADGSPYVGVIDKTWKSSNENKTGWNGLEFDDAAWVAAKELVKFGEGPWGAFDGRRGMTVSPLAAADPFRGRFVLPADALSNKHRVYVEMDDLPDTSAAVTVNGTYAGGVIGKPSRLDITARVKTGENNLVIEPLTPKSVRIVVYP
jgi:hypothetical protein